MNDLEQNFLAGKLLRILRSWIDKIIPEETKDCLRTKSGIIVNHYSDGYYDVVLPEDYEKYNTLVDKLSQTGLSSAEREELTEQQNSLILHIKDLVGTSIRGYYPNKTIVTIGYLDNKLTNAFILCSNDAIYKQ